MFTTPYGFMFFATHKNGDVGEGVLLLEPHQFGNASK